MISEMQALHKNHTWDLVPLPLLGDVVGNRWITKLKEKLIGLLID